MKVGASELVNTNEDLLAYVLLEVKNPDENFFAHIFNQERMDRRIIVIFRDIHLTGQREIENGREDFYDRWKA